MQRRYGIALLLIVVTAVVFWDVHDHEFVALDDNILVYRNPHLEPVTASGVAYLWRHPYEKLYMPLTYSSWAAIARVARLPQPQTTSIGETSNLDPRPFHLANLFIHLLNVLIVFAILRLLIGRDSPTGEWAAGAGALLFGIHPVQVEPVAWIAEMKGVLCGFFSLLALWQYLIYAKPDEGLPPARRRVHYILGVIAFVLALLSKPSAVAIPIVCLALDYWALRRPLRQSVVALLPWLAVAVLGVMVARFAQPVEDITSPLWWRPFVAGDALTFYLGKLLLPLQLAPDYGRTPDFVLRHGWGYLTWMVHCGVAAVLWLVRKRWPRALAVAGVFVAGLLPVLGLIPFQFQYYSTVSDRYLYLAMLGPALGLAYFLNRYRSAAITGVCVLWLATLGFLAAFQTFHWYDTMSLFERTLQVNPNSWVAHNNLGMVLAAQGKTDEAVAHYRKALQIKPDYVNTYGNLAAALNRQNKTAEAITLWQQALRMAPNSAQLHYNLAKALAKEGQLEAAMAEWSTALRLNPNFAPARKALDNARRLQEQKSHIK